jgi:hypothetical protein
MSPSADAVTPRAHARGRLAWGVEELAAKALEIRRDIVTLLTEAQSGHTGGPLGIADFGTALFIHELTLDPREPKWGGATSGTSPAATSRRSSTR